MLASRGLQTLVRRHPQGTGPLSRRLSLVLVPALITLIASPSPMLATDPQPASEQTAAQTPWEHAFAERDTFGLPTDEETRRNLLADGVDVGWATWGIPLTAAEEKSLDPVGRMTFVQDLESEFLPYVRSLSTFAGVWINQRDNGGVVVMLTKVDAATVDKLQDSLPRVNRGMRVVQATHTYDELEAALARAGETWRSITSEAAPHAIGLSSRTNGLAYTFEPFDAAVAERFRADAEIQLGVPITMKYEPAGSDTVCTWRDNCYDPFRAGIRIRKGSGTSGYVCGMGFHITHPSGGDEQFLTAGHCGATGSDNWYHQGFGIIGSELASLYYGGGKDMMRVAMHDVQASTIMYGSPDNISGDGFPVEGEMVCASLSWTAEIRCGTVSNDLVNWKSQGCDCYVWGGDTSGLDTQNGDSGSPLYRRVLEYAPDNYKLVAIGLMVHENGGFARVYDAIVAWGIRIYP
jgi:hypothetical protein